MLRQLKGPGRGAADKSGLLSAPVSLLCLDDGSVIIGDTGVCVLCVKEKKTYVGRGNSPYIN
eukprot:72607-Pelagomonas_calceolata.AAC.3